MGKDTRTEAEQAAAEIWVADGLAAVTFQSVGEAIGRSKSNVAHHFKTSDDLRRAAALVLDSESSAARESADGEAFTMRDVSELEAFCWLVRNGTE